MKKLTYVFIFIFSANLFAFERIGKVIEKDTLFHYENYDRVQYHKLREKEYQILSDRIKPIDQQQASEFIIENVAKIEVKEDAIVNKIESVEQTDAKRTESKKTPINKDIDPLMIQEDDIINISY